MILELRFIEILSKVNFSKVLYIGPNISFSREPFKNNVKRRQGIHRFFFEILVFIEFEFSQQKTRAKLLLIVISLTHINQSKRLINR